MRLAEKAQDAESRKQRNKLLLKVGRHLKSILHKATKLAKKR